MSDVADRAGVSPMTVSRVINHHPNVSKATRERVEQAIADLGYRSNLAARMLAGGRSRQLGVVSVDTSQFGPLQTLFGVALAARVAGHLLSFESLGEVTDITMTGAVNRLRDAHVEGIIIIAPVQAAIDAVANLHIDVPIVVTTDDLSLTTRVGIDQAAGARLATQHLLDLGHRTVHHISGPSDWVDARARVAGWQAAIDAAGAQRQPIVEGDWSAASGYAAGRQLAADHDVTAVFAGNDQMALGLMLALHEAGRSVPGDVSVVGFDDMRDSEYFNPPLTTIRQDHEELGRRCVDLMLATIAGESTEATGVAPQLVVRKSTAAPR